MPFDCKVSVSVWVEDPDGDVIRVEFDPESFRIDPLGEVCFQLNPYQFRRVAESLDDFI